MSGNSSPNRYFGFRYWYYMMHNPYVSLFPIHKRTPLRNMSPNSSWDTSTGIIPIETSSNSHGLFSTEIVSYLMLFRYPILIYQVPRPHSLFPICFPMFPWFYHRVVPPNHPGSLIFCWDFPRNKPSSCWGFLPWNGHLHLCFPSSIPTFSMSDTWTAFSQWLRRLQDM